MKRNKHKNIYVDKFYEGNYEYVILVNYKILTNRQIIRHEDIIFLEERNILQSNETEIHEHFLTVYIQEKFCFPDI